MPDDADLFGELQAAWGRLAAAEERAIRAEQEAALYADRFRRLRGRKIVSSALAVAESGLGGRGRAVARRARRARPAAGDTVTVDPSEPRRGLAVFVTGSASGPVRVEADAGRPVASAIATLPPETPGRPGRFAGWLDLEALGPGRYVLRLRAGSATAPLAVERPQDGPAIAVEDVQAAPGGGLRYAGWAVGGRAPLVRVEVHDGARSVDAALGLPHGRVARRRGPLDAGWLAWLPAPHREATAVVAHDAAGGRAARVVEPPPPAGGEARIVVESTERTTGKLRLEGSVAWPDPSPEAPRVAFDAPGA